MTSLICWRKNVKPPKTKQNKKQKINNKYRPKDEESCSTKYNDGHWTCPVLAPQGSFFYNQGGRKQLFSSILSEN